MSGDKLTINGTYLGDPEYDTGAAFSGALGMDFDGYRLEGEVAYQKNEIDNLGSDVSVLSVMANGYLDFQLEKARSFLCQRRCELCQRRCRCARR